MGRWNLVVNSRESFNVSILLTLSINKAKLYKCSEFQYKLFLKGERGSFAEATCSSLDWSFVCLVSELRELIVKYVHAKSWHVYYKIDRQKQQMPVEGCFLIQWEQLAGWLNWHFIPLLNCQRYKWNTTSNTEQFTLKSHYNTRTIHPFLISQCLCL